LIAAPLSPAVLGPNLPGAACKGRAPLHDDVIAGESETDRADRHQRAVRRVPAVLPGAQRLPGRRGHPAALHHRRMGGCRHR